MNGRIYNRKSLRERFLMVSWYYFSVTAASGVIISSLAHAEPKTPRPTTHQRQHQRQCRSNPHHPPFWGISSSLPSVPQQGKNFMNECESFVAFLERLRGGGNSDYYGDYETRQRRASSFSGGQYNGYNDDDDYYQNQDPNYYNDNTDDEDYYYFDDRGSGGAASSQKGKQGFSGGGPSFVDNLPAIFKNGDRKIGLSLVGAGTVITMLGVSLFFNKALLRLGNLLFIAGVTITMGIGRTFAFFFKPEKLRATVCLGLGIFLVFIGSPVFGMILEIFGLLNLFGNMFPFLMAMARTVPGLGSILNNNNSNNRKSQSASNDNRKDWGPQDDYYYDDYDDGDEYYAENDNDNDGNSYGGY